jgi:hypothetical protein
MKQKAPYKFGDIVTLPSRESGVIIRVLGRKRFRYEVVAERPNYSYDFTGVNGICFIEITENEIDKLN